jgi:hypothetical protein
MAAIIQRTTEQSRRALHPIGGTALFNIDARRILGCE